MGWLWKTPFGYMMFLTEKLRKRAFWHDHLQKGVAGTAKTGLQLVFARQQRGKTNGFDNMGPLISDSLCLNQEKGSILKSCFYQQGFFSWSSGQT